MKRTIEWNGERYTAVVIEASDHLDVRHDGLTIGAVCRAEDTAKLLFCHQCEQELPREQQAECYCEFCDLDYRSLFAQFYSEGCDLPA